MYPNRYLENVAINVCLSSFICWCEPLGKGCGRKDLSLNFYCDSRCTCYKPKPWGWLWTLRRKVDLCVTVRSSLIQHWKGGCHVHDLLASGFRWDEQTQMQLNRTAYPSVQLCTWACTFTWPGEKVLLAISLTLECGFLDLSVPRKLTCIYWIVWLPHDSTFLGIFYISLSFTFYFIIL